MNVQPGIYYGFQTPQALAQLAAAQRAITPEENLMRLGNGPRNAMPSWAGTANAIRDPYRISYYEQRFNIHRVWEDIQ